MITIRGKLNIFIKILIFIIKIKYINNEIKI